jgi:hypothetical protein
VAENPKIPKNLLQGIPLEFQKQIISAYYTGFERGMYQSVRELGTLVDGISSKQNKLIKSLKQKN